MCAKKGEAYNVYYEETNSEKWSQRIKDLTGEAEWKAWDTRILEYISQVSDRRR